MPIAHSLNEASEFFTRMIHYALHVILHEVSPGLTRDDAFSFTTVWPWIVKQPKLHTIYATALSHAACRIFYTIHHATLNNDGICLRQDVHWSLLHRVNQKKCFNTKDTIGAYLRNVPTFLHQIFAHSFNKQYAKLLICAAFALRTPIWLKRNFRNEFCNSTKTDFIIKII